MKFYRSFTQFYPDSGNSTGGKEVPVKFNCIEDAIKDCIEWLSKHKKHINLKPEKFIGKYWTTYTWTGEFRIYGKIKDVFTLSYQHRKEPKKC